jgi:hypothetical protein
MDQWAPSPGIPPPVALATATGIGAMHKTKHTDTAHRSTKTVLIAMRTCGRRSACASPVQHGTIATLAAQVAYSSKSPSNVLYNRG